MSGCPVRGRACIEHGFIHGGEAEELRAGIEKLIASWDADPCDPITAEAAPLGPRRRSRFAGVPRTETATTSVAHETTSPGAQVKDIDIMPTETIHKSFVTWGKNFGGHGTELIIKQYATWSEVFLKGGGHRGEWENLMHSCPIEVLREIVKMHDALPPPPPRVEAGSPSGGLDGR